MSSKFVGLAVIALILAACGGGGGGGGGGGSAGSTSGGNTSQAPVFSIALSASSGSVAVTEGSTATVLTTTATASSTGTVSTPIVADVQYDSSVFASGAAVAGSAPGTYTVSAQTLPDLPGGEYKGTITFRLCQQAGCASVYAGSTVTYNYDIVVNLQDWTTFQRNTAHTGFVHASFDASKFAKTWEWVNPWGSTCINPAVTGDGGLFVSACANLVGGGVNGALYRLEEAHGTVVWTYDLSNQLNGISPPSYDKGRVYVKTTRTDSGNMTGMAWAFDASTGTFKQNYLYNSQGVEFVSPTVRNDSLYLSTITGYAIGQVVAFPTISGTPKWKYPNPEDFSVQIFDQAPAADDKYVYYYDGGRLLILNVADGSVVKKIKEVNGAASSGSYGGGVIIGADDDILAFSGAGFPTSSGKISRFNITAGTEAWTTAQVYNSNAALAKGVVYAARNAPDHVLDAISEKDGSILWSWPMPAGDGNFIGNIIVTDNLVFVVTEKNTYAVDLMTHKSVWSYPACGNIVMSPKGALYIMAGVVGGTNKMTAISLK